MGAAEISPSLLIRGGLIVTMNDAYDVIEGDVSIRDGKIAAIARTIAEPHDKVIDAHGGYVLPGFVQTHIHLCQTLFRGYADDLPLMEWLRTRVWLMEAAHTPASLRAAVRLATTELLSSGTTSVLTMETVHDTDVVFEAAAESGIRATIGKCMMDAAASNTTSVSCTVSIVSTDVVPLDNSSVVASRTAARNEAGVCAASISQTRVRSHSISGRSSA